MTVKSIDAAVLRANLGTAIDEVAKKGNILQILRRGKSEVAMVDLDMLEDMLALRNPEYIKSIKQARAEVKAGKTTPFEDVFNEIMGV